MFARLQKLESHVHDNRQLMITLFEAQGRTIGQPANQPKPDTVTITISRRDAETLTT
jgi:hypothetical protein